MSNAIVMLGAIVPTIGHKYLIDFAAALLTHPNDKVHVILCSLDREPVNGTLRVAALLDTYRYNEDVIIHHFDQDVPQNPQDHPNSWQIWADIVKQFVDVSPTDYFVASEVYGIKMAEVLGCIFMPCNIYRETVPVWGTAIRSDLMDSFDKILPAFQHNIRKTITLFGAESCGKSTMAKWLAEEFNGHFVPEWAREYLETVGPAITTDSMYAIVNGQYALQNTAQETLFNKPFIFQDTDLLSTLGYYRIWGKGPDHHVDLCEYRAKRTKSDLYIVMNDRIPFETDPIRTGGDKRESPTQFWIDLLKEYNCNFYIVTSTDRAKQQKEVANVVLNFFLGQNMHIMEYKR